MYPLHPTRLLALSLLLVAGCGAKEDGDDTGGSPAASDTGEAAWDGGGGVDPAGDDADGTCGTGGFDSVSAYVGAYCDAILTRCGVYSSTEICVEDILSRWYTGDCVVQSQESAEECLTFLEGVSCEEQAWTSACDEVITCE